MTAHGFNNTFGQAVAIATSALSLAIHAVSFSGRKAITAMLPVGRGDILSRRHAHFRASLITHRIANGGCRHDKRLHPLDGARWIEDEATTALAT